MPTVDAAATPPPEALVSTGIAGLDAVLGGGLSNNRFYLVEGTPGSGKTTLALQFLLAGQARGERGLYVTLSETAEELHSVARSHGWSLDGVDLFDLTEAAHLMSPEREMTLLHPWEVELGETVRLITERAERVRATRIVFDSLSEMRLLAQEKLRFRRQILALKQFFAGRNATVLLLDDLTGSGEGGYLQLDSLSHGVIALDRETLEFGGARRRIEVRKMRASAYREGWHDSVIRTGGMLVFPRLVAGEHHSELAGAPMASGLPALDALLDGGPLRGTSTLITGPAGTGKTTLVLQYVCAAAARGERCTFFEFDERVGTLFVRAAKLGLDLRGAVESGLVTLRQIDPAQITPGELGETIRAAVETGGARLVVIDSLHGYLTAMPQERHLMLHLHELLSYLNQRGVVTFLLNPERGLFGTMRDSLSLSYLADTVLLLRFFEAAGHLRKAISVIKNRGGAHEETIREYTIAPHGLHVGEPLTAFRAILTGWPRFVGERTQMAGLGAPGGSDTGGDDAGGDDASGGDGEAEGDVTDA